MFIQPLSLHPLSPHGTHRVNMLIGSSSSRATSWFNLSSNSPDTHQFGLIRSFSLLPYSIENNAKPIQAVIQIILIFDSYV